MRRKGTLQDIDVTTWPVVAYTAFGETQQRAFLKRRDAVERYVRCESVGAIERSTGINRRQLYRMLERCLAMHDDGRLYGFRALTHYTRIAAYSRTAKLAIQGKGGAVGALAHLFERYPTLTTWITQQIKSGHVILDQMRGKPRPSDRLRSNLKAKPSSLGGEG